MINNRKHIFFIAIIFLAGANIFPQGYWKQRSSPTDKLLRHVFFVDSINGWAVGGEGIIIHTTDTGISWIVQNSTVTTPIVGLFFLNKNTGWALTWTNTPPFKTIILKTSTGGDEWVAEDFPEPNIFMQAVYFFDEMNGWTGGTKIMGTTDGGSSWFDANVDSNFVSGLPVISFNFYSRQYGFASGGFRDLAGVVWRTTNFGISWEAMGIAPDPIHELYIADSLKIIGLSGDPEGIFSIGLVKTTDAGFSWSFDEIGIFGVVFAFKFRTPKEGWAAVGSRFLYSLNGGDTWTEMLTPDSTIVYDLCFPQPGYGIAVGSNGVILKYDLPVTGVEKEESNAGSFRLYQNYPNPFNPVTRIRYTIPTPLNPSFGKGENIGGIFVSLKVYDVLGKEVATLINKELAAGEYVAEFDGSGLTSGIYYYRLQAGKFAKTEKMIYLK